MTSATTQQAPVTVVLSRRPKPGREAQLGEWLRGVLAVASEFPGYQGTDVVAPDPPQSHEYVVVFRWESKTDFDRWHASAERAEWLERVEGMSEAPVVQTISGLEPWFTVSGTTAGPPKWKMALATFTVIWALSSLLAVVAHPWLDGASIPARTAFSTAVLVPLLTWVVMPRVSRLLSRWLYRG